MHKILAVARREIMTRIRTKTFLLGTFAGPLLILAFGFLPALLANRNETARSVAVLDAGTGTTRLGERMELALRQATMNGQPDGEPSYRVERIEVSPAELEARLEALLPRIDGSAADPLTGILVVTPQVLATDSLRYYGRNAGSMGDMRTLRRHVDGAVRFERMAEAGVDPSVLMGTLRSVDLVTEKVTKGRVTGESGEASFVLAYAMSFILYITLLLYGNQMMISVVEEKSNRINEILVSSIRPFELLMGKVLGVGGVALIQVGIWAMAAFLVGRYRVPLAQLVGADASVAAQIPIPTIAPGLLVVFLLFFVLGFLFYSAAYAAVGATCNTLQETQQAAMPVTLVIAGGFVVLMSQLNDPGGTIGRVMSYVPLVAPFVVPVRYSQNPIPWFELLLLIGVMALGVAAMAWIAGRIYRVGILMYGKRASLGEVLRWVRAG